MFRYFSAPRSASAALLAVLFAIVSVGCRSSTEERLEKLNVTPQEAKRILAELSARRAEHEAPLEKPPSLQPAPSKRKGAEEQGSSPIPAVPFAGWLVDELVDVAPAAPSRATPTGVLVINGANELFLAKVGALSKSRTPVPSPVASIPDEKGPFALGRGPALAGKFAYWVTSHFLLRRPVVAPYGPLDIVAKDARVGTRAAALTMPNQRAVVAYIALPTVKNGPLRAKLWVEQDEPAQPLLLTEPGASALSVELVEHEGRVHALSLEARMGMTALHSRIVTPQKRQLADDQVEWIGGTAQPMTEVRALSSAGALFAFLAIEQDISHFGLAVLELSSPGPEPTVHWTTFENGQDPAPVASARACNTDLILFARPSTPLPRAPQELVLAKLVDGVPTQSAAVSAAKAFYDLSIAPLPGGALLSFVADERTWARTIRCR